MIKIEVKGLSGLAANFRVMDAAAQAEIRTEMRKQGEAQRQATAAACPKDTGYMASQTRADFSPEGLTFAVGYRAEDFPGTFYPPFVILGTSRMAANDFLFHVHEMMTPETTRAIGDALRRSFARFAV